MSDQEKRGIDPCWAWAPYRPDAKRPWDLARASHLHRRAGLGADWAMLQSTLADGPQKAVDRLMNPPPETADFNARFDEYEGADAVGNSTNSLRSWWLRRMIQTPHPLLEKMVVFWHGYLAANNAKVRDAALMQRHLAMLRRHALGRFDALLGEASRDPAMLLTLGAEANRKSKPTPHYARALFEQFTMGPGNFTDADVEEAARAMTGWFVLRGRLRYFEREHDTGRKRVLGREGDFDIEDVVRIALGQPSTPRFLVRRLFQWLISEVDKPPDALIDPLAEMLAEDYDVGRLVERMLRSNLFFSEVAYRRRVKCPVEFAVGMIRAFEGLVPTERLGADLAMLGQDLCYPPTTHGWPGGRHWLNSATLVGRAKLAGALLSGAGPYAGRLDPAAVAEKHGRGGDETAARFLVDLLLGGDIPDSVRARLLAGADARRTTIAIAALPEFQLA